MSLKLAVVVPVYNEETSILSNLQYIHSKVLKLKNCTLLVVNDGSTDNTKSKDVMIKYSFEQISSYLKISKILKI